MMKAKLILSVLAMILLPQAHAQYWPADTECSPGDIDCLRAEGSNRTTRNSGQYYSGRSSGDGFFYEVRCVGGNWTGPVCFETGIIMARDRHGYRYYSGQRRDNGSYYCAACGGR